jgi:hypothetical protein
MRLLLHFAAAAAAAAAGPAAVADIATGSSCAADAVLVVYATEPTQMSASASTALQRRVVAFHLGARRCIKRPPAMAMQHRYEPVSLLWTGVLLAAGSDHQ